MIGGVAMRRPWLIAGLVLLCVLLALGIAIESGASTRLGIVYVAGASGQTPQVWLAGADGRSAVRLGPGQEPLLAPDGALVAASSPSPSGAALLLYPTGGSRRHSYFDVVDETAAAQAFSPDSRYLAVVLTSTDPASDAASGLAVIDTRTYSVRIVARGSIYGASFATDGSDRLVFASAPSASVAAPVNVRIVAPDGSGPVTLTRDGRSLNPVWGPGTIVFDHERLRSAGYPAYQIWLMRPDGTGRRQVTRTRVPPLLDGLVPIAISPHGDRLLAEYEGQDTSQAWLLALPGGSASELRAEGHSVTGAALSRDGASALIDLGGYLNPPSAGVVDRIPLDGGRPTVLVPHGAQPSWNL